MKKRNKGVTLIELIVSFSILSIVLGAGYSLYAFNSKTFSSGTQQYDLQNEIRLASQFITNEVRNAKEFELVLVSQVPVNNDGYNYIYINDGILYSKKNGTVMEKTKAILINLSPYFNMVKLTNENNILEFELKSEKFSIQSKVALNNISRKLDAQNQAIKYKK